MDFETQQVVTLPTYLRMIELKTAVLLAASLKIGAIIAGASPEQTAHLYAFGRNIGLAFQLMDDVLDTYGIKAKVGKRIGGDILQNKKTYLLVQALAIATPQHKATLNYWLQQNDAASAEQKIAAVKAVYNALGVRESAEMAMQAYYKQAFVHLQAINVPENNKKALIDVVEQLMYRQQ
jgi:geranylgeranyl diphosphate synthase type II